MSDIKKEYMKRVVDGLYEVLDLANYDIKQADEIVEKAKKYLIEDRLTEIDLVNSQYAYVFNLLNAVEEWETVENNLDNLIREAIEKAYLDRESMIKEV